MIDLEKKAKEWVFALAEARVAAVKRYKQTASKHVSEDLLIHLAIAAKLGNYDRVLSLVLGSYREPKTSLNLLNVPEKHIRKFNHSLITLHPAGELKIYTTAKHISTEGYNYQGDFLELYKSGQVKKRGYHDEFGYRHGDFFEFDQDGIILFHESKDHGEKNGSSYISEPEQLGVIKTAFYTDGRLHGVYTETYQNKRQQKKKELWYNNGKVDGPMVEYYPDGTLKTSCHYANNKLEGRFLEFDIDGKELTISNYKNNLRHGSLIRHSKDIKGIKHQAHYQNGILDGDVTTLFLTSENNFDKPQYIEATVMFNLGIPDLS